MGASFVGGGYTIRIWLKRTKNNLALNGRIANVNRQFRSLDCV